MAVPASPGLAANDKSLTSQDRANGLVTGTLAAVGPGKAFSVWGPFNVLVWANVNTTLTIGASGTNSGTVGAATNIAVGDSVNSTLVPPGTTVKTIGGTTFTFGFPTQTWRGKISPASASIAFTAADLASGLTLSKLVGAAVSDPNSYFPSGVTVLGVGPDGLSVLTSAAPTTAPTTNAPAPIEFALTANSLVAGADTAATFTGAATPVGAATTTFQIERSLDGGSTFVCANIGGSQQLAQFVTAIGPLSVAFGDPEANALYRVNMLVYSAATNATVNYRLSATGQAGLSLSTPAIM
jgi:hypothetical protein